MKNSLIQLQVFYEIAMSIGNSLDIDKMLQESLTAYLRKLDCSAGAVFRLETLPGGVCRFVPVYSIPREIKRDPTCLQALKHIPGALPQSRLPQFLQKLPIYGNGRSGETNYYHIMELPDFGLLLLVKSSTSLEPSVLKLLIKLNEKLARSCVACLQNETLKQTNERLEKEIQQRQLLEEAFMRARNLETIGILAGGVAHDFNNLLAVILGNTSMAKLEAAPESSILDLLNEIENASLKAVDLTQKFITFSSGGAPLRKTLSIKKLIENVVSLECSGSDVVCLRSFPCDLWEVVGDEGQLRQVFYNVIENASEAMPYGGNVEIKAENIKVSAGKRKGREAAMPISKGSYVKIVIKDYGCGIPEGAIPNLFDPYYSTKQRGTTKGMGFGLTITYSIIAKHGGDIHIESKEGKGTAVYIYLPAKPGKVTGEKDIPGPVPAIKKRVLIMDYERMVVDISQKMLMRMGYEVGVAKNGEDAVALYRQTLKAGNPFNVVILDLNVKAGMNAEGAIKQLVQIDPEVKAIVTGSDATDPIMSDFREYGFRAVLTKPFMWNQLQKALKKLLDVEV